MSKPTPSRRFVVAFLTEHRWGSGRLIVQLGFPTRSGAYGGPLEFDTRGAAEAWITSGQCCFPEARDFVVLELFTRHAT